MDGGGRVLLVKRSKPPRQGAWTLPGGHVEFGESLTVAALRELTEETGLVAQGCRFLSIEEHVEPEMHLVIAIYSVDVHGTTGNLRAGDDALETAWISANSLSAGNSTYKLIFMALKAFTEQPM